jgi:prepilin-type N-terminal cleavage/methylation domain-containing protein
MKFYFQKQKNKEGGFTLLEVLIAITILFFAITATFTAAQSGLQSSIESKNQVIAYYLAQEAVEYIRNIRDTNSLLNATTPTNWLAGIANLSTDPCWSATVGTPGQLCYVDAITPALAVCPSGVCPNIRQDTASTYAYGTNAAWAATTFKRTVQITVYNNNGGNNEAAITVNVVWSRGSFTQTFTARESIFNWQT